MTSSAMTARPTFLCSAARCRCSASSAASLQPGFPELRWSCFLNSIVHDNVPAACEGVSRNSNKARARTSLTRSHVDEKPSSG
ncbi:unnamed protein product [Symbiodinium microadriaticum]|nr:unnamed protein product [Symbiodinium microadriaticum]CAE7946361.1 unnamed protein product [Symbiodinium sp. KB8]